MAVSIPQVVTEGRASSANITSHSLRFDQAKGQTLYRTPGSSGNSDTWTLSWWMRRTKGIRRERIFGAGDGSATYGMIVFDSTTTGVMEYEDNGGSGGYDLQYTSITQLRDCEAWYHMVLVAQTGSTPKMRLYCNGVEMALTANNTSGSSTHINGTLKHEIGVGNLATSLYLDSYLSHMYMVDGQALTPSYFGYQDPLTNNWKRKKFSISDTGGTWGTNGFYLPFDGSAPIGEDQSGNGNHWIPNHMMGSAPIEVATGAYPIYDTVNGGRSASAGIRTDSNSTNLVLAVPLVGIATDMSNIVNSGTSEKQVNNNGATASGDTGNFYDRSFKFDGSNDYVAVATDSDFDFGSGECTVEAWVYIDSHAGDKTVVGTWTGNISWQLTYAGGASNDQFMFSMYNGSTTSALSDVKSTSWIDQWVHLAGQRDGNTLMILVNGRLAGTASFSGAHNALNADVQIGGRADSYGFMTGYIQDVRIYKGKAIYDVSTVGDFAYIPASAHPELTPHSPLGGPYSSKIEKSETGSVFFDGTGDYFTFAPGADAAFGTGDFTVELWAYYNGDPGQYDYLIDCRNASQTTDTWSLSHDYSSASPAGRLQFSTSSTALMTATNNPIPNRWSHIAVTRNGTALKMFIDGKIVASATDSTNFSTSPSTSYIGTRYSTEHYFEGLMSNLRVIKGTAAYTGAFRPPTAPLANITNTKLLCFNSTTSATNYTISPSAITANGGVGLSQFNPFGKPDTAIGIESNFVTFNPLDTSLSGTNLRNGNLDMISNGSWSTSHARGTVGLTTGRWYWEATAMNAPSHAQFGFGTIKANLEESYSSGQSQNWTFYWNNGREIIDPAASSAEYFGTGTMALSTGDTMAVALDMDKGTWQFFRKGVGGAIKTLAATDDSDTYSITELYPFSGVHSMNMSHNFGQKPFKYTPPKGFQPVCLANMRPPKVVRPEEQVGVTTYIGNSSNQCITGLKFKPDLVWIKNRTSSSNDHMWFDTVRGFDGSGDSLFLECNNTDAEDTDSGYHLTSFNDDGFSLQNASSRDNYSGSNYVAWCWKAGGDKGTWNLNGEDAGSLTAAGLNYGDTSKLTGASVNTKAGFSIVTWEQDGGGAGSQIAHGLTRAPEFVIMKHYNSTSNWFVTHNAISAASKLLYLNEYDEEDTSSDFGNAFPSATYTSTSTTGVDGRKVIMYSWHSVDGLQKFGGYFGNGDSGGDGPFIWLGFRPAIFMWKRLTGANANWYIVDDNRSSYGVGKGNPVEIILEPNTGDSDAVTAGAKWDFLSNGVKQRGNADGDINASNTPYAYCAWAASPSNNYYGSQSTAFPGGFA